MPYCSSIKFESSIAISSHIHLLKCQPKWPTGSRAIRRAVVQTRQKMAKIVNFCQFFSHCSCIPHHTQTKFKSSIAIPSPVYLLKFPPNWPTSGWAISQAVGQARPKSAKIVTFCQFFIRCSCISYHTESKFESSIAIPLPIHLLKFQPNQPTGGWAISCGIRIPSLL